jgi:predicted acetyltransferase
MCNKVLVNISEARVEEKTIIQNLMQYYLYEFSEISDLELDDKGRYPYKFLECYWSEDGRHPYLITVDGKLAGFALLRRGTYFPHATSADLQGMLVAEFFVLRDLRRQGIGTRSAVNLFERFPGRWEIGQQASNLPGQAFWRTVIRNYCGEKYDEYDLDNEHWCGPVQVFNNAYSL